MGSRFSKTNSTKLVKQQNPTTTSTASPLQTPPPVHPIIDPKKEHQLLLSHLDQLSVKPPMDLYKKTFQKARNFFLSAFMILF